MYRFHVHECVCEQQLCECVPWLIKYQCKISVTALYRTVAQSHTNTHTTTTIGEETDTKISFVVFFFSRFCALICQLLWDKANGKWEVQWHKSILFFSFAISCSNTENLQKQIKTQNSLESVEQRRPQTIWITWQNSWKFAAVLCANSRRIMKMTTMTTAKHEWEQTIRMVPNIVHVFATDTVSPNTYFAYDQCCALFLFARHHVKLKNRPLTLAVFTQFIHFIKITETMILQSMQ